VKTGSAGANFYIGVAPVNQCLNFFTDDFPVFNTVVKVDTDDAVTLGKYIPDAFYGSNMMKT